ncbi:hypothetical protein KAI87_02150 [Myxococcota bacterium]|nr:hypothetical protein [Myxococcota bacterium]
MPSARSAHALAYDSAHGVVVLFGGYDGGYRQDTWEWNGESWTNVTPTATKPSARFGHAMTYDSTRGVVVLFGGEYNFGKYPENTWEWKITPEPAIIFNAKISVGGIINDNVTDIHVRAHCGGQQSPYTTSDNGATLYGYSNGLGGGGGPGEWWSLGSNDVGLNADQPYLPDPATSNNAALLEWQSTNDIEVQRYITDSGLHFQCRPAGDGPSGFGNEDIVAMDYIEVRVRYRLE